MLVVAEKGGISAEWTEDGRLRHRKADKRSALEVLTMP